MSPAIYTVLRRDGQWTMVVNSREVGHFATESQAIKITIETAHEAGRFNLGGAQVILVGQNEMSRIIWTYGQDPFPPTKFE